jgi:hypothetical protein
MTPGHLLHQRLLSFTECAGKAVLTRSHLQDQRLGAIIQNHVEPPGLRGGARGDCLETIDPRSSSKSPRSGSRQCAGELG